MSEVWRHERSRHLLRWIIYGSFVVCGYIIYGIYVFGPALQDFYKFSNRDLYYLFSAMLIGGMTGRPLAGILGDRLGHRLVFKTALLCLAAALAGLCFARNIYMMSAAVFVVGFFVSASLTPGCAILLYLYPGSERRTFTLSMVVIASAGVLWPVVIKGLIDIARSNGPHTFDIVFRVPFAVIAVLMVIVVLLLSKIGCPEFKSVHHRQRADGGAKKKPIPLGPFMVVMLLVAVHCGMDAILSAWMPTVLAKIRDGSNRAVHGLMAPEYIMSAYSAAYMAGRLILSALPELTLRRTFLVAPGLLGGGLIITGLLVGRYEVVFILFFVGTFVLATEYPNLIIIGGKILDGRWGDAMGLTAIGELSGVIAMTVVVGQMAKNTQGADLRFVMLIPAFGYILFGIIALAWLIVCRGHIIKTDGGTQ